MSDPKNISIHDFDYELPNDRIAAAPLKERDASSLLIWKNHAISEDIFRNLDQHLPAGSLIVFNNSRVINARIRFEKAGGGTIEIFCLEPSGGMQHYSEAAAQKRNVEWSCLVGGIAKWKTGSLQKQISIGSEKIILTADKKDRIGEAVLIGFSWNSDHSFSEIMAVAGAVPLPPYIKRKADENDTARYQTVFARADGSVAAPTAGLHFTPTVLESLSQKSISTSAVTLHVSAGTFKPVKADLMSGHEMHPEYLEVSRATIEKIRGHVGNIIAVGTTSLRTIESLYVLGKQLIQKGELSPAGISQWETYETADNEISATSALDALLNWMDDSGHENIFAHTRLLITPGYRFRLVNILVTNFHQPRSTLLLLVAAAVGSDWRKLYEYALQHDFRFLSYGDANLIFIDAPETKAGS